MKKTFTFHNVSINSGITKEVSGLAEANLHSIMYLLIQMTSRPAF